MKKIIALILAMVMALSLVACGQTAQDDKSKDDANSTSAKTFIMGIDAEYPPFSYLDADGNYTGFGVEVCKAACDLLEWELQIFPVNWDQKLVQLDAKECDCVWSGMTILDSMKEAGYVLSTPYYDNTQVIMVKEGSDIKSSADLAGKVVAVQLGTSGEALLSEGGDLADLAATFGDLMTCDSFLKCFTELGGAAVDAVIVDKPVAVSYAAENAGFTVLDEGLGAEQYGIAFRADDAELCKTIEGAHCGRWFLQKPGMSYTYCDRPSEQLGGKTCRGVGAMTSFKEKSKNDPLWQIQIRAYKKYFARVRKGTMSKADFEVWSRQSEQLRDAAVERYRSARTDEERNEIVDTLRVKLNEV